MTSPLPLPPPPPAAARARLAGHRSAAGDHGRRDASGTHSRTSKRFPFTSTSTWRSTFGTSPSSGGRRRRLGRCLDPGEVERLLDPLRGVDGAWRSRRPAGWPGRPGSWWRRPRPSVSSSARMRPVDRGRPVGAPHDQLPDQVVVVLADLVAGLVAAVPAGAEARRHVELGDLPGRGQEAPAGGVLGVDPDLDGVAAPFDGVLLDRQRLARRHPDLLGRRGRCPVTISVTGCSTWSRVFISRKKNSPSWKRNSHGAGVGVADGLAPPSPRPRPWPGGSRRGRPVPGSPRSASGGGAAPSSPAR